MSDDLKGHRHNSSFRVKPDAKPLARGAPLPKRNAKRKGHRFPKNVDEPYREFIRGLSCSADESFLPWFCRHLGSIDCKGAVECAHVKTRGAGGKDRGNCVPLCTAHHRQQHDVGIKTFAEWYDLDLADMARELERQYDEQELAF
jgi:hypothetical protein